MKRTRSAICAALLALVALGVGAVDAAAAEPTIESVVPSSQTVRAGQAITPVIIKGTGLATVTTKNPLPSELTLKAVPGHTETEWELSGIAKAAKAKTTITFEAKNAKNETAATATTELTVLEDLPTIESALPTSQTVRAGQAIAPVIIKGTGLATVTTKEPLPSELTLKAVPGHTETEWELSGTPMAAKAQTTITFEAKNAKNEGTATATTELTVLEDLPTIESVLPASQTVHEGQAIARVVIKGTRLATVTVTAKEPLPSQLTLKAVPGHAETEWELTGAPVAAKSSTAITFEAKNASGEKGEATASTELTVLEEEPPVIEPVPPQFGTVGVAITPVVITGPRLVELTERNLPPGLIWSSEGPKATITGTPTTPGTTTLTIVGENKHGVETTITFTWTINPAPAKSSETPAKPPETPPAPKVTSAGRLGTMPVQKPGAQLVASFLCEVASCKVTLGALVAAGHSKFHIHSAAVTIPQGSKIKIPIKLTKKQRALIAAALKKHKKVTAAISATIQSSVGAQLTKALTVSVKR